MADGGTVNPNPEVGAVWTYYGATLGGGWSLEPVDTSLGFVTSFNGRTGAVELVLGDVTAAGGAPIASPSLSGMPTAPTALPGTSTTQIATTQFVTAALTAVTGGITSVTAGTGLTGGGSSGDVTLALSVPVGVANGGTGATTAAGARTNLDVVYRGGDTMRGDLLIVPGDGSSAQFDVASGWAELALANASGQSLVLGHGGSPSEGWVTSTVGDLNLKSSSAVAMLDASDAEIARFSSTSITLNVAATAPTPSAGDNSTRVATTAFVKSLGYQSGNQTITLTGDASGSGATTVPVTLATVNANVGTFQGLTVNAKGLVTAAVNQNYAPLASPVFTGDPQAPTPAVGDNDTSIATTAWVKSQGYSTGSAVSITAGAGITVTPSPITGSGSVALTVPVTVGNGGTGLSTLTAGMILVGNAGSAVNLSTLASLIDAMVGSPAAGEILHRNSLGFWEGLSPGTTGQVLTANGAGANLTWGSGGGSSLPTPVSVANGGTGVATLTAFAPLLGNGTGNVITSVNGSANTLYASNGAGSAPTWKTLSNLIDATLAGGAGATGQILHRSSIGFWSNLNPGTSGQFLKTSGAGANVSWSAVDLANAASVTGVLPLANGGTGAASAAAGPFVQKAGVTDGSNAAAGQIGEFMQALVSTPTSFGGNGVSVNAASLSLTAGDWDVYGLLYCISNGATLTQYQAGIHNVSATLPAPYNTSIANSPTAGQFYAGMSVVPQRFSLTATTTVYLIGNASYSTGTPQYQAKLEARRVR